MITFTYYNHVSRVSAPLPSASASPSPTAPITRTGELICLPHKNHSGPETLECALGLKASDGHNYGLKNLNVKGAQQHKKIKVTGALEQPGANQLYDIVGSISVTSVSYM